MGNSQKFKKLRYIERIVQIVVKNNKTNYANNDYLIIIK